MSLYKHNKIPEDTSGAFREMRDGFQDGRRNLVILGILCNLIKCFFINM